ncbi:MAG: hypothetical protein V1695_00160 [Candidatus Uhrbacteria bacterium]
MFLALAFAYLDWLAPQAMIPAILIVVCLIVFSLLVMLVQCIFYRPKEWKRRPLTLQVLYASKRISLAEYSPISWCMCMLRKKRASLMEHFFVWSVLPLIVSVTELQHFWFNLKNMVKHDPTEWSVIEYILDKHNQ